MYFILNTKVDKMSTGYHYFSSEKKLLCMNHKQMCLKVPQRFPCQVPALIVRRRVSLTKLLSGNGVICVRPSNLTLL